MGSCPSRLLNQNRTPNLRPQISLGDGLATSFVMMYLQTPPTDPPPAVLTGGAGRAGQRAQQLDTQPYPLAFPNSLTAANIWGERQQK